MHSQGSLRKEDKRRELPPSNSKTIAEPPRQCGLGVKTEKRVRGTEERGPHVHGQVGSDKCAKATPGGRTLFNKWC